MPVSKVTFTATPTIHDKTAHRVYVRERWGDQWQLANDLWCIEVAWSVAPTMPTASLLWHYGSIKRPTANTFTAISKSLYRRVFVKIEVDSEREGAPRVWVGVIELDSDQQGGTAIDGGSPVAVGQQIITAYGMEKLLADNVILTATCEGVAQNMTDTPPNFNARGKPNKANGQFLFGLDNETAEFWTTRSICLYLTQYQSPRNVAGAREIQFLLDGTGLPDWDKPEVQQAWLTTYTLLDQLINRRRLLIWWCELEGSNIRVKTDTIAENDIPLQQNTVPANSRPIWLVCDNDPATQITINRGDVQAVDRVVVRGERRRSVGSFSYLDGTMQAGWSQADEAAYTAGASGSAGFAALGKREQRRRNEEARTNPKLANVYCYFSIPKTWNRKVKDGEGGTEKPLFPVPGKPNESAFVYYPGLTVEQDLPLVDGVDYADDAIANGSFTLPPEPHIETRPAAYMRVPGTQRWVNLSEVGRNADLEIVHRSRDFQRFAAAVRVPPDGRGIFLDVHGAPKHALDGANFGYLPTDETLGKQSYKGTNETGLIFTFSVLDDRYCEGIFPATVTDKPPGYVTTKLIWAQGFRKDYVAPGTVVRLDVDGTLKRSTGGFIPKEGPDDDEHKLEDAARIAGEWYTKEHFKLFVNTTRQPDPEKLALGMLVVESGETAHNLKHVNSPITDIQIYIGQGRPGDNPPPRLTISTFAGELDALQFIPPDVPTTNTMTGYVAPDGNTYESASDYIHKGRLLSN